MDILSHLKKGVAFLTLTSMAFFISGPMVQANLGFTDDAEIPSWAEEAIEELMDQGVISGNDDGSFAPNRQLNRAEVSKIIVLGTGVDFDTTGGPHFPDVSEGDWFYDYIETMYNYGWVNGYPDGEFRPGVGIGRAELAKMVVNAFEIDQDLSGAPHFDDVNESDWFYGYVETAYNNGLMRGYGDGTFGPGNAVTRAETSKIVYDSQLVVAEPTGPAEGTLEAVLSDDTPRGTNVPYNATSVPYTTVELTASDDSDVEISSLTFTRLGLGDNDDFENVWLEIDGFKVGNDKSINNDDVVELRFNPPIVVPAGQTIVADVVASAKYTSSDQNLGHHNRLALVSADDVVSTAANVVGDFPIEGEEMEVADYEVSQIQFSILGSNTTIDVGDSFIEIGKFRMLNASNTNKDVEVRAITFKNDGSAEVEDTLENVALYVSGEQVSAETIIDGDYVTFRLDNGVTGGYVIEDGDSRIFSIRADIVSAEKGDTLEFKVDNFEDIVGVEIGTAFGIKALYGSGASDSATCTSTSEAEDECATLREYTIDSGDLNVSRDSSSLGNQQYAPGSNDVVVLTARLVVDQPLLVDGVTLRVAEGTVEETDDARITLGASTASDDSNSGMTALVAALNDNYDNFRLYLDDKLIDSENDFVEVSEGDAGTTRTTDAALEFSTTFEIAGTTILKLVANIQDGAGKTGENGTIVEEQLKMSLFASDFSSPEYISTGDQVESNQLLGSAEGSFVEVTQSSLDITRTDGLSDGTSLVAGVDDVTFLQFVLDNNDSGDVNVTSVSVEADDEPNENGEDIRSSGSARTYTNFTAAIFVNGTQQGSAKNLSSAGAATFNDLSVVVPSSEQEEFVVVVDTIESSAATIETTIDDTEGTTHSSDATWEVATASGIKVGDIIVIEEGSNSDTKAVTAVDTTSTPNSITVDSNGSADYSAAATVTVRHQLKLDVVDVDADNVENGQEVTVYVDGTELADGTDSNVAKRVLNGPQFELVASGTLTVSLGSTVYSDILVANSDDNEVLKIRFNAADDEVQVKDIYLENDIVTASTTTLTVGDESSIGNTTALAVASAAGFSVGDEVAVDGNLVGSITAIGTLTVTDGAGDIDVDGDGDADTDDDGTVDTITLSADIGSDVADNATVEFFGGNGDTGNRFDYALYDENGDLLQEKQMTSGALHFELANQDRIRAPKDDSTFVTIQADVRDITRADQTGYRVRLALDADEANYAGVEAVTAATGNDIELPTDGWGDAVGETFVAYRTQIAVNHASSQPSFTGPSTSSQEVYRFTVSADAARQAEIERVTFDVSLAGMQKSGTSVVFLPGDFDVKQVKSDGTVDDTATIGTIAAVYQFGSTGIVSDSAVSARVVVDFDNQQLSSGESSTYALFLAGTEDAGGESDDDSVSVTIVRDSAYLAPANEANAEAGADGDLSDEGDGATGSITSTDDSNIVWSDESSSSHSSETEDWLNGYLVDIDTTAQVNDD